MCQVTLRVGELEGTDLGRLGVPLKVLHKDEAMGTLAVLTRIEVRASSLGTDRSRQRSLAGRPGAIGGDAEGVPLRRIAVRFVMPNH